MTSGNIIQFPAQALSDDAEAVASAWEGLVRVMEANGRARVEIGIAEARTIAKLARGAVQCA